MTKIHTIQGYIQSIYLVEENDCFLLLDGCCRPDVNVVFNYIENTLGKNRNSLKLVIATHAHPDHVGGLELFKKSGVMIAGPKGLNVWYNGVSGFFRYFTDIFLTYLVALNKKRAFKNIFYPKKHKLNFFLKDQELVPGFKDWMILETPGHTSIDLTIYNKKLNIAYIADNLVGSKFGVFSPYPINYPQKYRDSLQRYIDLGIENFLLAHHGQVKLSASDLKKVIDSISKKPRRHTTSLHLIVIKLIKSIFKKLINKKSN